MVDKGVVAGLAVLGIIVLLVIVGVVLLAYCVFIKIKELNDDIAKLEQELDNIRKIFSLKDDVNKYVCLTGDKDSAMFEMESEVNVDSPASSRPESEKSENALSRYTMIARESVMKIHANIQQPLAILKRVGQSEYKTKTSEELIPDEIDITANEEKDRLMTESIKRRSIWEGRPTSYIMDSSMAEATPQHKNGVFVHQKITPHGGRMTVSGVFLSIPEGAVKTDTQITLGVVWEESFRPKLSKNQALLSPLIVCQPSVNFTKPVRLTFPHCAHKLQEQWDWTILQRSGDINAESDWSPIAITHYDGRELTTTHVQLDLRHFTGFTLIGKSAEGKVAAKAVNMVAFTNQFQTGAMFKTKIYCVNNYHYREAIQGVKEDEKEMRRRQADGPTPLLVYQNEENVVARLSKYSSDEWRLEGDSSDVQRELNYHFIMHDLTPSCTFVLSPKSNPHKIFCEYSFSQRKSDIVSKLKIADEAVKVTSVPIIPLTEDPVSELHRQLVIMLDPKTDAALSTAGDWMTLASKVGIGKEEIVWLDTRNGNESPTETVLTRLSELGKTYEQLYNVLIDIERPDAAKLVQEFLNNYDDYGEDVAFANNSVRKRSKKAQENTEPKSRLKVRKLRADENTDHMSDVEIQNIEATQNTGSLSGDKGRILNAVQNTEPKYVQQANETTIPKEPYDSSNRTEENTLLKEPV